MGSTRVRKRGHARFEYVSDDTSERERACREFFGSRSPIFSAARGYIFVTIAPPRNIPFFAAARTDNSSTVGGRGGGMKKPDGRTNAEIFELRNRLLAGFLGTFGAQRMSEKDEGDL